MARLLVIENDAAVGAELETALREAGHHVELARTGAEGVAVARETSPNLILLDLVLPDISGIEVMRRLSATDLASIPIILLSDKGEEIDRVVAFEVGASDFVVKPFSVRELVLRVQAVLRRVAHRFRDSKVTRGRITLDRDAHRTWVDEREVALTPIEFRLLLALHEHEGRILSRGALLEGVWGGEGKEARRGAGTGLASRTVDTHVNRLRTKLGPAGSQLETVRRVGYRLVARELGTGPAKADIEKPRAARRA